MIINLNLNCYNLSGYNLSGYNFSGYSSIVNMNSDRFSNCMVLQVRPLELKDFHSSMRQIRPSVSRDLIHTLEQWNACYGVSS